MIWGIAIVYVGAMLVATLIVLYWEGFKLTHEALVSLAVGAVVTAIFLLTVCAATVVIAYALGA